MAKEFKIVHGAKRLHAVRIDSSNIEMRDADGYVGDHANGRAFRTILQDLRRELAKHGDDPLGNATYGHMSKKEMDAFLIEGEPEAAGVVHGAIEEFAHELASIIGRFLDDGWKDTERAAVGGGLRDSRVGEIAIGRTATLLKTRGRRLELVPIRHHPDDAGLIGALHLVPPKALEGYDGMLAVDIGGSNIRAGIVRFRDPDDLSDAKVGKLEHWRHRDEDPPPSREQALKRLVGILKDLAGRAEKDGCGLAPFIGIGCPGSIAEDGSIARGSQNLPGDWEEKDFNLARTVRKALPKLGGKATDVIVHNDAVVQGLSQIPFMHDVKRWGVLTIGTGLGNARFTNLKS